MVMKTYFDLLDETANFYNLSNRGYNNAAKNCTYLDSNGNTCAIGRILKDPGKFSKINNNITMLLSESFMHPKEDFKEEYSHLDNVDILEMIQDFHDSKGNWTDTGLSEEGKKYLESTKISITEILN